jgi:hypothetical protein
MISRLIGRVDRDPTKCRHAGRLSGIWACGPVELNLTIHTVKMRNLASSSQQGNLIYILPQRVTILMFLPNGTIFIHKQFQPLVCILQGIVNSEERNSHSKRDGTAYGPPLFALGLSPLEAAPPLHSAVPVPE